MSSQRSDTPNQRSQETVSQRREDDRDSALYDPFASSKIYYGTSHGPRKIARSRAYTFVDSTPSYPLATFTPGHRRRTSLDEPEINPIQFWLYVDKTTKNLLDREDTDGNVQITIEDAGLKTIELGTAASGGYRRHEVRGTYKLSNLLQELTLAKTNNRTSILLDGARLTENPVDRLSRYIKDEFWDNLTRRIDGSNVGVVARDPKDWTSNPRARIYIPRGAPEQHEYYTRIAAEHPDIQLDVQWLKEPCDDPRYVRDLNEAPGLLAVAMERIGDTPDGKADYRGLPFVVPGGRFNELYGWDSYMESIGLLLNDRVDLGEAMVKHFCFCIRHYGKILNANRTYYLCRSQPPFLTDMAIRVHERIQHRPDSLDFLREAMLAAIKEYYTVWTAEPRFDPVTSLSRYMPGGLGVPPETEATHFIHILAPYAEKHNMDFADFVHAYNYGLVSEPDLDEYFLHDRAVRESGHDTTYRFESVCAHLATVDLNSLLYKYESDISRIIRQFFGDKLVVPPEWQVAGRPSVEKSSSWDRRARQRRERMNRYMWDESKGMFFDYHTVNKKHTGYETATTFWAMWAGVCNPRQATIMVDKALPRFEVLGGLVSGTEESRGPIGLHRPSRQWDYPFGWAPQQILAWMGLIRYGYEEEAQRLAYRWAFMMTKAFVDFNGVVVEKYDVTRQVDPHKVDAEYGNQGADFKGVALEGFGWVNASYVLAMSILTTHMKRALGALAPWDTFESKTRHKYSRQANVGQPPSHSEDVQSV